MLPQCWQHPAPGAVIVVAVVVFGAASFSYPSLTATFVSDHVSDRTFAAVLGSMTMFYGPASVIGPAATRLARRPDRQLQHDLLGHRRNRADIMRLHGHDAPKKCDVGNAIAPLRAARS